MYKSKNSLITFLRMHCKGTIPTLSVTLAIVVTMCAMSQAAPTLPPGNTVQQWNTIAENTVVGSGAFQAEGFVYMAYASAAVYDAVVSIQGGYEPYSSAITADSGASTEAAAIEAAYRTLVNYFPGQAARWAKAKGVKVVSIASNKRRKLSSAAIARIRAAQKARWAKWRKQKRTA